MALTGEWEVSWGDTGSEKTVLQPFDGIVVPPGVLRAFRNTSNELATLLVVLRAHNVGHVVWARDLKTPFREAQNAC